MMAKQFNLQFISLTKEKYFAWETRHTCNVRVHIHRIEWLAMYRMDRMDGMKCIKWAVRIQSNQKGFFLLDRVVKFTLTHHLWCAMRIGHLHGSLSSKIWQATWHCSRNRYNNQAKPSKVYTQLCSTMSGSHWDLSINYVDFILNFPIEFNAFSAHSHCATLSPA